jgi:hypothetical protein
VVFQNRPQTIKRYAPFVKSLDVPTSAIDDAPYVCLILNEQWLPFILGACETLRWEDLYKGTPEQIEAALQEVERLYLAFMVGNTPCPEDMMFKLRQSPDNPCHLQQSLDGGETWMLAFDFSLCARENETLIEYMDYSVTAQTEITNIMTTYNNDITNVAPDWGYGDADDVFRDAAQCWAARMWVDAMCQIAIDQLKEDFEQERELYRAFADALEGMGEISGVLAGLGIFTGTTVWMAVGFAVSGGLMEVWAELIDCDTSTFEDEDAKEEVACEIYFAMKGATPTFAKWSAALVGHQLTGNAAKIADFCKVIMQEEEAFVTYYKAVGEVVDVIRLGVDLGCPCEGDWTHKFRFDFATGTEEHVTYDNNAPQWNPIAGYYDLPTGGWCSVETVQPTFCDERVLIDITIPASTVTRIRVDCDYQQGYVPVPDQNKDSLIIWVFNPSIDAVKWLPFAWFSGGHESVAWEGLRSGVTKIRILWRCSYSENMGDLEYGDGHVTISYIEIKGKVDCPFE